ncbi:MAG: glycosyltransferase family 4 protein, partial [Anaerolineae bacterium]
IWEQVMGPVTAVRHRLDLWHSAAFVLPFWLPCPAVVTVYDLSFMQFPDSFPAAQRWYLATQTRRSCRRARRVVAISESGRQDVHRFFGVPLDRIDVVVPGVEPVYRPLPEVDVAAFRQRVGRERPFVLHVGTLQPRKNIPTLLAAFAQADLPGHDLALVGGKGWLFAQIFEQVARLGLTERVHFTGYVPDEELPLWYNAADLFVFPSLYEGFGMPVVEAMACGTPVLAAAVSSIPEAAGEAAGLFDPQDVTELAERMTAVLNDAQLSATMREKGLRQAARFSWERAGREWTAVYRRALAHL